MNCICKRNSGRFYSCCFPFFMLFQFPFGRFIPLFRSVSRIPVFIGRRRLAAGGCNARSILTVGIDHRFRWRFKNALRTTRSRCRAPSSSTRRASCRIFASVIRASWARPANVCRPLSCGPPKQTVVRQRAAVRVSPENHTKFSFDPLFGS